MGKYFDDPTTRSPYVAFGLSSLFPQTGGATSTQINDLFCLPTSLRRRMVEFSRTRLGGLKMGEFSRTVKLFCFPTCPEKLAALSRTQINNDTYKRFTWTSQ